MKIRLDAELCTGHGRCYSVAPNLFSCDDEGFGQVIDPVVAPEHEDEARMISARAAMLEPARFEHHAEAQADGVFSDETRLHTRVVDGACIFLNRPGFAGGAGCALHLEALAQDESPVDWKPSVCWQLPIKVDWELQGDDTEVATVRRWTRQDWGAEGTTMAWCCTEEPEAFVGDQRVLDSMGEELEALVGPGVYVELRRRFDTP
jgi:ferredoxin